MSTRVFVVDGDDAVLERCARLLQAEGAAVKTPSPSPIARLDGYTHVVDVILALVNAERDVRSLEALAEHLRPRVSVPTIRGWFYAAGLRASSVLALGRLIRAFRVSQARGVRLSGALGASDKRTLERFFERAGLGDGHTVAAPQTLEELLSRQRLVRDPGLLDEVHAAMRRLA
jgi:hypothetical protein